MLFIDARPVFRQLDRAHRDWTPAQSEFLANIVRLFRGQAPEWTRGSQVLLRAHFPDDRFADVPGLCYAASLAKIEEQGWSFNPGRYVGVAARRGDDFVFLERLQELDEELQLLTASAHDLEERISENVAALLSATPSAV